MKNVRFRIGISDIVGIRVRKLVGLEVGGHEVEKGRNPYSGV